MKPLHIFLPIFYVGVSKQQDSGEPLNDHHFVKHGLVVIMLLQYFYWREERVVIIIMLSHYCYCRVISHYYFCDHDQGFDYTHILMIITMQCLVGEERVVGGIRVTGDDR